jgi:hypothetical protein
LCWSDRIPVPECVRIAQHKQPTLSLLRVPMSRRTRHAHVPSVEMLQKIELWCQSVPTTTPTSILKCASVRPVLHGRVALEGSPASADDDAKSTKMDPCALTGHWRLCVRCSTRCYTPPLASRALLAPQAQTSRVSRPRRRRERHRRSLRHSLAGQPRRR